MTSAQKKKGSILTFLRKTLLVYLLIMVALGAWLARVRSTDWNDALRVGVYPVNGDDSAEVAKYIERLEADDFTAIAKFLAKEGQRYGMTLDQPLRFEVSDILSRHPPAPPVGGNVLEIMAFSLKLRYYAWRQQRERKLLAPDIRLFVQYYDPDEHPRLAHSLGLKEGLIGVVNAYGSRREIRRNHVVIAHELLHTLGASDKYDPATSLPIYPDGYAEPDKKPRWPQSKAEIMGGRVPLGADEATMPERLSQTVVGEKTAREIRWLATP